MRVSNWFVKGSRRERTFNKGEITVTYHGFKISSEGRQMNLSMSDEEVKQLVAEINNMQDFKKSDIVF